MDALYPEKKIDVAFNAQVPPSDLSRMGSVDDSSSCCYTNVKHGLRYFMSLSHWIRCCASTASTTENTATYLKKVDANPEDDSVVVPKSYGL